MSEKVKFEQINDPYFLQNLTFEKVQSFCNQKLAQIQKKVKQESTDIQTFKWKFIKNSKSYVSCLSLVKIKPQPQNYQEKLQKLDFPTLSFTVKQLRQISLKILTATPKRKALCVGFDCQLLIKNIADNYSIIPYHNFSHAFSLFLMFWQCSTRSDLLRNSFTQIQWLDMLIAGLAHDLCHPGTNNALEAHLGKGEPAGYLQRYHITKLWQMIRQNKSLNFLAGRTQAARNQGKELINRMIMSTDVSKHFQGVEFLKKYGKNAFQQDKISVADQIFHACDIGNPCLPFQDYMTWGALVSWQFNEVDKQATEVGLTIPNMKYQGLRKFYQGQKGFTNFLVFPLWKQLQSIIPGLSQFTQNIKNNLVHLDKAIQETKQ